MLFHLKILWRGAADGTLVGGRNTLQLLAADGARHRDAHRRVRGLAGLNGLAVILGKLGDGDLAGYDILHGVARAREGVFHQGEVYVRRSPLARELLGHVARDVAHEAPGSAVQPLDSVLGPGELPATALGDERSGLLEGGVVDGAFAAGGLLDLLFGVGDGAAATFDLRGLSSGLLAVLLLDVLAGYGGVALLERALLHPRPDPPLLLPLFQSVEELSGVVGPVQLATVVDLSQVQFALGLISSGYTRVYRVEVSGARAADGTLGRLAFRDVAADVALEAVLALGGAADLLLHVGGDAFYVSLVLALTETARAGLEDFFFGGLIRAVSRAVPVGFLGALVEVLEEGLDGSVLAHLLRGAHLVADGAHRLHRAGGEDVLYDLVNHACGYDRVALLYGVPDDGARRHADHEARDAVKPLEGLLGPGHVLLGCVQVGGLVLEVGYEDVRRQIPHHVLGVPADVHLVVGVVADAAHDHERRVDLFYVLEGLLEGLAGQQRRLELDALVLGDLLRDLEVGGVDLGEPRVDDLLVQLLLLLEAEDLLRFGRQYARDRVEHRIVEVRVEDGDRFDGAAELPRELDSSLQSSERLGAPVYGDDDVLERAPIEVLDYKGVGLLEAPHDALGDGAEHRVLDGGHAHRAYDDEVVVAGVHVLDDDLEVLAFEGATHQLDVVFLAERLEDVDIRVGDYLQAFGDELVVDLALPLHLVLVAELLGQPALHLPEAHVVHLRGVGVAPGHPAPELARHVHPYDARLVRVVRVVYRDIDLFVHRPRSPSLVGRREIHCAVARGEQPHKITV